MNWKMESEIDPVQPKLPKAAHICERFAHVTLLVVSSCLYSLQSLLQDVL